jgi:hypothetical protein
MTSLASSRKFAGNSIFSIPNWRPLVFVAVIYSPVDTPRLITRRTEPHVKLLEARDAGVRAGLRANAAATAIIILRIKSLLD